MLRKQARVFSDVNLISDFFRGHVELGDIYQTDDKGWLVITNIFELLPELDKADFLLKPSSPKDIQFIRETGTSIDFGAGVSTTPMLSTRAKIGFSKKNSAFVALKKGVWQNINLVKIKPILNELWESNGYSKKAARYFFVNQVCKAESGITIFSEEKNNEVVIQSTIDKKLSALSIISEGQVEVVTSMTETLEIISDNPHSPIFQAVRMKKNNLWEIMG